MSIFSIYYVPEIIILYKTLLLPILLVLRKHFKHEKVARKLLKKSEAVMSVVCVCDT